MNIVVIDFETYFDNELTLKKMTTTTYVRDPNFMVHGAGIYEVGKMNEPRWLSDIEFREWASTVDWTKTAVLAHNTAFDGFILSQIYSIVPAFYYDTLSMARAQLSHDMSFSLDHLAKLFDLGNKVPNVLEKTKGKRELEPELYSQFCAYCCMDVALTYKLFDMMLPSFPEDELKLIDITLRCFCDPVIHVNERLVKAEILWQERKRNRILKRAGQIFTETGGFFADRDPLKLLSSSEFFAEILQMLGVVPPVKPSPTDPTKLIFAFAKTDKEFQVLQQHEDDLVAFFVEARLNAKSNIDRTRAQRMLEHSKPALPLMYNYAKAHTLRWTGGDKFNPQNFRRGGRLRRAMEAPEGYVFVSVDSGQIENRVTMMLAGQDDVLDLYRNKQDIYVDMASSIYRIPKEEITSKQRFVGKTSELGLQYGCGSEKLHHILTTGAMGPKVAITLPEVMEIVHVYRTKRNKVPMLWKLFENVVRNVLRQTKFSNSAWAAEDMKPVTKKIGPLEFAPERVLLPNGLALFYRDILYDESTGYTYASGTNRRTRIYGGLLTENIVQCLSRILVGEQIIKIAERYRVVLMTHDECGYIAPAEEAEEAKAWGLKCFTTPPVWMPDIPLSAEAKYARYYSK